MLQFGSQQARPARDTRAGNRILVVHAATAPPKLGSRLDILGLLKKRERERGKEREKGPGTSFRRSGSGQASLDNRNS